MFPVRDELPTSRPAVVTVALIAANVLAFLWQQAVGLPASVELGGFYPGELIGLPPPQATLAPLVPPPLTILTSMFLHGSFGHILGNMWFLWIFGNNVEDALGRGRFVAFYLCSGVAAALAQAGLAAATGGLAVPMVGASGAIAGVLAGYMRLYPRARVVTWFPPVFFFTLPAAIFLGLWFAFQLAGAFLGTRGGGGVAFMAHVGGFVAGLLLVRRFLPAPPPAPPTAWA